MTSADLRIAITELLQSRREALDNREPATVASLNRVISHLTARLRSKCRDESIARDKVRALFAEPTS
jgi:hypothetical protein